MSQAKSYQCPSCAGVVYYDETIGMAKCTHCGSVFEEGEIAKSLPVEQSPATAPVAVHAKSAKDFLSVTGWTSDPDVATHAPTQTNLKTYSCPSCGAQVAAEQSVVSTDCPYCGNNMLVSGIATPDTVPATIMPFELTREQAIEVMREQFEDYKSSGFLEKEFDAQLEHVKGAYVPYYLFDASAEGTLAYVGGREPMGENGFRHYCPIVCKGRARFEAIPVDASSKMPDGHMDAIGPFDFRKLRPFSTEYVPGYLMEVPDESAAECAGRARAQAEGSIERDLVPSAVQDSGWFHAQTVGHEQNAQVEAYSICAVPVWLLHGTWKGKGLLIAVNGSTGKCAGTSPYDKKQRQKIQVQSALFVAAIISIATLFQPMGIAMGIGLGLFCASVVGHVYMRKMNTAIENRYAIGMYSAEGLVIFDRWLGEVQYERRRTYSRTKEVCWNKGIPIEQGERRNDSSIYAEYYDSHVLEEAYERTIETIGGTSWRGQRTETLSADGQPNWLANRGKVKQLG